MRPVAWAIGALALALAASSSWASSPGLAATSTERDLSVHAFAAMEPVIASARCLNCHTAAPYPTQGDDEHRHFLNVQRGDVGRGQAGLHCTACHGVANNVASGAPGAPDWHLAPRSMAWQGLSAPARCRAMTDPLRNGHRSGAALVDHLHTGLVRWAWMPGTDQHGRPRSTPPVDYDNFLRAANLWVAHGAHCPA